MTFSAKQKKIMIGFALGFAGLKLAQDGVFGEMVQEKAINLAAMPIIEGIKF